MMDFNDIQPVQPGEFEFPCCFCGELVKVIGECPHCGEQTTTMRFEYSDEDFPFGVAVGGLEGILD